MGLSRLELLTFPLSEGCSNQLSYRPSPVNNSRVTEITLIISLLLHNFLCAGSFRALLTASLTMPPGSLPRKEVIQPQLPLQLPCYDFIPVTSPTLGSSSLTVRSPTSGVTDSHDVTGGVYKARERIHRTIADARLLATPPSSSRVADCYPN
jgi:hypothetical protein